MPIVVQNNSDVLKCLLVHVWGWESSSQVMATGVGSEMIILWMCESESFLHFNCIFSSYFFLCILPECVGKF